eukprot:Pgem_evm1s1289
MFSQLKVTGLSALAIAVDEVVYYKIRRDIDYLEMYIVPAISFSLCFVIMVTILVIVNLFTVMSMALISPKPMNSLNMRYG